MNYFTKNRVLTLVLMLLVAINLAAFTMIAVNTGFFSEAKADDRKPRIERSQRREAGAGRMMENRLGLNGDQKAKLEATRRDHMNRMRALSENMDEARDKMDLELNKSEIDLTLVEELNQRIAKIDVALRNEIIGLNVQTRKILSEEQLVKYIDMRKDMSKRWRGRDGSRHSTESKKRINSK